MKTLIDREDLIFSPPELGCVLYLPGLPGGGSKIYDRSPYGNIGTITGATWVRLPSGLWYLDFDGSDDKVSCGDADCFSFGDGLTDVAFTIKFWAYMHDATGFRFCSKMDDTVREYMFCSASEDQIILRAFDADNQNWIGADGSAITSYENIWTHFVMTYDASGVWTGFSAYINAVADTLAQNNYGTYTAMHNTAVDFHVGDARFATAAYADGGIALLEVIKGIAWTVLDVQNSFTQEKHLFGVWSR